MKTTLPRTMGALLALATVASSLPALAEHEQGEDGSEVFSRHRANVRKGAAPPQGTTTAASPILYHGGPVMGGTPTAYVIWYGNWNQNNGTDTPEGKQIVTDFLSNIGGSPYMAINATYNAGNTHVSGYVSYGGSTTDTSSQGKNLTDSKVKSVVQSAINSGRLPRDVNGVYFVLTSSDINEVSGFCSRYCGWHSRASLSGKDIKYSFVGNAARCLGACSVQSIGPNGNAGVDGMVSVIAHELEEAISDPDLNAWYDRSGAENADKCAWTFGHAQYQVGNSAWANVHLGARDYLIQRNLYHGVAGDFCAIGVDGGGNITP